MGKYWTEKASDLDTCPNCDFHVDLSPRERQWHVHEIDRLETRLEVYDSTGQIRMPEDADGIGCRDETIKLLDERVERLLSENKILRDALEIIKAGDIFPMAYEGGIARDALDFFGGRQDSDKCQ